MKYVFTAVYTRNNYEPLATVAIPIVPLLRLKHGGAGKATVYDLPAGSKILWDHEGEFDPAEEGEESYLHSEVAVDKHGDISLTVWCRDAVSFADIDTTAGWDGPALCFVVPKDGDSIVLDISTVAMRNYLIGLDSAEQLYFEILHLDSSVPPPEDIHSVDIELSHSTDPAVDNTVNIWNLP